MKLLKSTLVASALILGTASVSFAQDKSYGSGTKVKDAAVDKATDMAKDKADAMMKDKMMKDGEVMMKDKAKSYGSGAKVEDAMMKEGDAMMKDKMMKDGEVMMKDKATSYGSGTKVEGAMMEKGDVMMKDKMMKEGTIKTGASYGSATPAAAVPTINCPAGTTAQANGTCMITGNYLPRS